MKARILAALLFTTTWVQAQDLFDFGLKGGLNIENLTFSDFNGDQTYESLETKSSVGYHAGFYGRFTLAALYIQPELLFTNINTDITAKGTENRDLEISFNRIDVPVLVGANLGLLRLGVGPVMSFNMKEQHDVLNNGLKGGTLGYQAGLGLQISKLSIELRYEGPLTRTASEIQIGNTSYPTDVRTKQFIVGLGLELF